MYRMPHLKNGQSGTAIAAGTIQLNIEIQIENSDDF